LSDFYDIITLNSACTGLKYAISITEIPDHDGPFVKVCNVVGRFSLIDNFTLSIEKDPVNINPKLTKISSDDDDEEYVKDWIKQNYEKLMILWKMYETGTGDIVKALSTLEKLK
jgi:hypothetical protein